MLSVYLGFYVKSLSISFVIYSDLILCCKVGKITFIHSATYCTVKSMNYAKSKKFDQIFAENNCETFELAANISKRKCARKAR
ncbi:hypothetical protein TSAR_004091 [Trichomalopsis sarcophagae]|uniref:Uncharacterized protein n=1 Tax=Trichomalopsis sarcophagae TaxID=543379 RepID=A0A232ET59_9HYME|nr:hypothetical protein TSAR_004091 [Trichomalopsis sarcophagae]